MKFKDNLANNKFDLIQDELEEIKKEKKEIIDKVIEKDIVLNSLLPKSNSLKNSVIK